MRKLDTTKGQRTHGVRTICEVHRQIYDFLVTRYGKEADDICDLLDEAFVMGIKMNNRLVEQKIIFESECPTTRNIPEIERLRKLRIELTEL